MKALAFDTSGPRLSVAVLADGRVAAGFDDASFGRHAESLAPAIDRALRQARIKPSELDLIAVGTGPGSFTGLRIGVTTAKTLALALGAGLVGVCSFEAVARAKSSSGVICVVTDAKRDRWHAALYERGCGGWSLRKGPSVVDKHRLALWAGSKAVFAGEPHGDYPQAEQIGRIALEAAAKKRLSDPRKLVPLYLHPKDCNATKPKNG